LWDFQIKLDVGPGDRVATLMDKSQQYLITLMSIWRLGTVHVPLFTAFAPPAIAVRLLASDAKTVVCDPAQLPSWPPVSIFPSAPPGVS
jgi:acetyl-CoA synthetase